MPRKNRWFPFVKLDDGGRLTYERRIPQELRPYFGNRASIRRTLGVESTDPTNASVISAYAEVHSQVNTQFEAAKQALRNVNGGQLAQAETFPLSPRDVAGIAADPLLQIRKALADGRITGADPEALKQSVANFLTQVVFAKASGDMSGIPAAIAGLSKPVLDDLQIQPTSADQQRINQQMLRYAADARADIERLQAGDFSEGTLARKAPAKPKRKTTWKDLFAEWRRKTGGTLEIDGYGVSEDRDEPYLVAIKEFEEEISRAFPAELTIDDGRRYVRWLQEGSGKSIRTQQGRLGCLRNLLKIGKQEGLLDENVFTDLKISTPSGAEDESGYRPFTRAETIDIFKLLTAETDEAKQFLHYILLCTGCRLNEALQLRTHDIKQTDTGVWFIDFKHEPTAEYPMLLKTKALNNRQTPLHPRLIAQGFLDIDRSHKGRLFPIERTTSAYSVWFKQKLQRLGIWEARKTVLHSLRGTARDLWRSANIPQDYRNAFTGHKSKEVGEASYGLGLANMPDQTYKEISKVDLKWLP